MGAKAHKKLRGMLRAVLSRNLSTFMAQKYGPLANDTAKNRALAKAVGISPETVRRILNEEVGPSLDTLELIAEELDISPYRLIVPSEGVRQKFAVSEALTLHSTRERFKDDAVPRRERITTRGKIR